MNGDEGQIPNPKLKIPRKSKTQNPKVVDIFDIFEFGNLDFLWFLDLVTLGFIFYLHTSFSHYPTKIGR
jgi:hypothetical protein